MLQKSRPSPPYFFFFLLKIASANYKLPVNSHNVNEQYMTTKTPGEPAQLQSIKAERFLICAHAGRPQLTVGIQDRDQVFGYLPSITTNIKKVNDYVTKFTTIHHLFYIY